MDKIFTRLQENYDRLIKDGHEVLGVFLQGSQNYGLAYENSDIDCKAIIVPTLEDIVLNKKPISTTLVLENDEHIDLKDIRLMFDCFKKQNINFVEILFTKYRIMNPEYESLYQPMFDNAEAITHYNNYAALNCMVGMMYEKQAALQHPYPNKLEVLAKHGYDPKQAHHVFRLYEFIRRYLDGETFANCLISKDTEYLIKVKRGEYDIGIIEPIVDAMCVMAKQIKQEYMDNNPVIVNKDVEELLNKILLDVISYNLKKCVSSY